MSFEERLLDGLGQAVMDNTQWPTYRKDLAYTPGEMGVYFTSQTEPTDRAMTIRLYPVDDSVADNDVTVGVQFEIRSRSLREVLDTVEDLRALLHRAWNVTLGSVMVTQSFRRSGTGSDSGGRVSYTENYYLTVNRS